MSAKGNKKVAENTVQIMGKKIIRVQRSLSVFRQALVEILQVLSTQQLSQHWATTECILRCTRRAGQRFCPGSSSDTRCFGEELSCSSEVKSTWGCHLSAREQIRELEAQTYPWTPQHKEASQRTLSHLKAIFQLLPMAAMSPLHPWLAGKVRIIFHSEWRRTEGCLPVWEAQEGIVLPPTLSA